LKKFNKVLLGTGLSGCIFAFYNKLDLIITKNLSTEMKFPAYHFVLVHNHPENKELLEELRIPYYVKKIKIKYYYYGDIFDKMTVEMHKEYMEKKLIWKDINLFNSNKKYKIFASEGEFEILSTNFDYLYFQLFQRIVRNNRIYQSEINEIDLKNKIISLMNGEKIKYNYLISSIPATIFLKLIKSNRIVRTLPATYCIKNNIKSLVDDTDFDEMIVCSKDYKFIRIRKLDGIYIIEFTGMLSIKEVENEVGKIKAISYQPITRFEENEELKFKDVYFVGRFASLNPEEKIQDVILKSKDFNKMVK
jgi:hypothetical protein